MNTAWARKHNYHRHHHHHCSASIIFEVSNVETVSIHAVCMCCSRYRSSQQEESRARK